MTLDNLAKRLSGIYAAGSLEISGSPRMKRISDRPVRARAATGKLSAADRRAQTADVRPRVARRDRFAARQHGELVGGWNFIRDDFKRDLHREQRFRRFLGSVRVALVQQRRQLRTRAIRRGEVPAVAPAINLQAGANYRLVGSGLAGANYILETSTNLLNWTTLTNLTATNGAFEFDFVPNQRHAAFLPRALGRKL